MGVSTYPGICEQSFNPSLSPLTPVLSSYKAAKYEDITEKVKIIIVVFKRRSINVLDLTKLKLVKK